VGAGCTKIQSLLVSFRLELANCAMTLRTADRAQRELVLADLDAPSESRVLAACDRSVEAVSAADQFRLFVGGRRFRTILADPPWQFQNRTGKIAPEHKRLSRYATMTLDGIKALPVEQAASETAHLYLWVPNALLPDGLAVMQAWGFHYKSNIVWQKVRKDGGPDGRGVGFYFRNVTELLLFGVRGKNARTLPPGRRQVNILSTRKREHSRKPDEQYELIESCSPGPFFELFARGNRPNWTIWGDQADEDYMPSWPTYAHHSRAQRATLTPG
jgi:N6-adenosine-specific RNA methylase IME4